MAGAVETHSASPSLTQVGAPAEPAEGQVVRELVAHHLVVRGDPAGLVRVDLDPDAGVAGSVVGREVGRPRRSRPRPARRRRCSARARRRPSWRRPGRRTTGRCRAPRRRTGCSRPSRRPAPGAPTSCVAVDDHQQLPGPGDGDGDAPAHGRDWGSWSFSCLPGMLSAPSSQRSSRRTKVFSRVLVTAGRRRRADLLEHPGAEHRVVALHLRRRGSRRRRRRCS